MNFIKNEGKKDSFSIGRGNRAKILESVHRPRGSSWIIVGSFNPEGIQWISSFIRWRERFVPRIISRSLVVPLSQRPQKTFLQENSWLVSTYRRDDHTCHGIFQWSFNLLAGREPLCPATTQLERHLYELPRQWRSWTLRDRFFSFLRSAHFSAVSFAVWGSLTSLAGGFECLLIGRWVMRFEKTMVAVGEWSRRVLVLMCLECHWKTRGRRSSNNSLWYFSV